MKLDITHIAKLANLTLSEEEEKKIETQLSETAEYVKELEDIDTQNFDPISQVTGLENITREDEIKASFTQEESLKNAKSTYKGFFKVKGILTNE